MRSQDDFDPSVALMLEDVAVDQHDSPKMVCIRLKQSKTDPFWHGVMCSLAGRRQTSARSQHSLPILQSAHIAVAHCLYFRTGPS